MILRKLIMHNFGVYASTNQFNFCGEGPVVLIGGMNGRGKTTFLEAVLLVFCLVELVVSILPHVYLIQAFHCNPK